MDQISIGVYQSRAVELASAMKLCSVVDASYPSAVALLAVHSAIAFQDAVQVKLTGHRSQTQDHMQAVRDITKACTIKRVDRAGIKHLQRLVTAKTDVAYGDRQVTREQAETLRVFAERFQTWAEGLLRMS